ncbi:hypothetical protein BH10PSE17_BH10PSE17_08390 [soil metagenome]
MKFKRIHAIGLIAVGVAALALNSTMPVTEESIASEFASEFAAHFPEAKAERIDANTFLIQAPGTELQRVDISGMQQACKERPRACSNEIASALITTSDSVDGTSLGGGSLIIRPSIELRERRPDVVVALVDAPTEAPPEPQVISEPLADDLVVRYELHTDYSGLAVGASQLQSLNLTAGALRGIALQNLRSITAVRTQTLPGYPGVMEVMAPFAPSSFMIDLPRLAELIDASTSRAHFAIPQREKLFYVRDEAALPELERAIADFTRKEDERLTRQIFVIDHGLLEATTRADAGS